MRSLLALALLTVASACTPAVVAGEPPGDRPARPVTERPRNVVFMIADGFGPASVALARAANGAPLALDGVLTGSVSTAATDSRVTDSAAGATAYACGLKTLNGAIAVTPDGTPCRTVLEAARDAGFATGLVATSRITHATPAAYAAHVPQRADEAEIASQMAVARVDVLFGGGARFFLADSGGGRTDGRDLTREMSERGVAVATGRAGFDGLRSTPAVALLAPDHMAYEIDRDETDEPSLAEMTVRALDLLAASPAGRDRGFFVMVEGSRIDHAGHANDAAAHLRDVLAYDAAVRAALDWARRDGNTLVVSTADHETGGLSLGRDNVYAWDPAPLLAATMSAERLAARLAETGNPRRMTTREALIGEALGDDSLAADVDARLQAAVLLGPLPTASTDVEVPVGVFREIVDRRAGVAWTTGGHTAVDVGLYAFGPGADAFRGHMANDAVGRATFAAFGLALPPEAEAAVQTIGRAAASP